MDGKTSSRPIPARRSILIVDDHPLVRRGLIALIEGEPDLAVSSAVASPQAGLEALAETRPDLVIADLSLGDGDGLGLVEDLQAHHPELPVLVLTMHDTPHWARRAFEAGAAGFVTKQEMTVTLLEAIRRVLDGERYLSPGVGELS